MQLKYALCLFSILVMPSAVAKTSTGDTPDSAEVSIGERLFLETRFAQAWYAHPDQADPVLDVTATTGNPLRGAFAGKTINCRACHMVDEHAENKTAGMRSYTDFARRSPIPQRGDGHDVSTRNAMSLVDISIPRDNQTAFHYDGEFTSMEDLVIGTLTARNYGWLASEKATAMQHIARVIREDDGKGELGREYGGSYRKLLSGTAVDIAPQFRLPAAYRVNVATASDQQIVSSVAKLISAYMRDVGFSHDAQGRYNASPYDRFLMKNALPRKPAQGESAAGYTQRLADAIAQLPSPKFVEANEGKFTSHSQAFVFDEQAWRGMQLFFRQGNATQHGGNCAACHHPPHFSDFGFHNTGVSQAEYDGLHGQGAFQKLAIPDLAQRNAHYDQYLPATDRHPNASGRFRDLDHKDQPTHTDLGLWNVFANPDMPGPQTKLQNSLCQQVTQTTKLDCQAANLLPYTLAAFKTPLLRDLGHSAPYLHGGNMTTLEETLAFYVTTSDMARHGVLRNADPQLQYMQLGTEDIKPLLAFLNALNEDYD